MLKIEDRKFKMLLLCADCRAEMNSTTEMTAREVEDEWMKLALGSALVAGRCPKGCRATFSDCNINTRLVLVDAGNSKPFDFQTIKFLFGHFYSEDEHKICLCDRPLALDEVYDSDYIRRSANAMRRGYPTGIHGRCGRWTEPFPKVVVVP